MYSSRGVLAYSDSYVVANLTDDLAIYYRRLIPKWITVDGTRYSPHITVIRYGKEQIAADKKAQYWRKYEGQVISFKYEPRIYSDIKYFFLNAYSRELEDIRIELGLAPTRFGHGRFHITIGNQKSVKKEYRVLIGNVIDDSRYSVEAISNFIINSGAGLHIGPKGFEVFPRTTRQATFIRRRLLKRGLVIASDNCYTYPEPKE